MNSLQVAIDVGGTFIDLVMAETGSGRIAVSKVPNDIGVQSAELIMALERLAHGFEASLQQIDTMIIGTTVVTNALLERTFARVALLMTDGFRDVLEIGRANRPSSYDLRSRRPKPIVPRHLRYEIAERIGADGAVISPLNLRAARARINKLRGAGIEAVAISFLFSFANPEHERRAGELVATTLGVPVSLSSDVLPVFREYERTSTTVINAATSHVMGRFIEGLETSIARGVPRAYIMGSEGGCLTLPEARRYPVRCIMSGPAGGVIGSARLAADYGLRQALTLDIGGTSTDVALIHDGALPFTDERVVAGYPVALPSVEVETVGAGGGSIAHVDATGLLKVGPQSAGANPGPICYRRGGTRPTVTDAHVVLGRIGTRTMLGGDFDVDREAALRGIEELVGTPLRLNGIRAAQGILQVVTANIVRAVRLISVERGHDPRQLTLIAFGGAGPLHAVDVARALDIPRVLVPQYPGAWSAFGILSSDIRYSAYRTWLRLLSEVDAESLAAVFDDIVDGLTRRVTADGLDPTRLITERAVDLRYRGQSYTLTVPLREISEAGCLDLAERFHRQHEHRFGHAAREDALEIVNLRATLRKPRAVAPRVAPPRASSAAPTSERSVWFVEDEPLSCPVYQRAGLARGQTLDGPAIIEQYDSTLVLSPADHLEVQTGTLDLLIEVGAGKVASGAGQRL